MLFLLVAAAHATPQQRQWQCGGTGQHNDSGNFQHAKMLHLPPNAVRVTIFMTLGHPPRGPVATFDTEIG